MTTLAGSILVLFLGALPIGCTYSACPTRCHCDTERRLVDCQDAGLTRIPWDLPNPSGLRQLDLRGNNIHDVVAEIVSYVNLEHLDLSNNQIISISKHVFDSLPTLRYLSLQKNRVREIDRDIFTGLNSLRTLDLSHNDLELLPNGVFKDLQSLEDLRLAGNELRNLSASVFEGLFSLRYLELDDNHLSQVPSSALQPLRSLISLNLDYNDILGISSHGFEQVRSLERLSLDNNQISFVDMFAFQDRESSDLLRLEYLSMRNNQIAQVPTSSFTHLSNVIVLDLGQNPFVEIGPNAFSALISLRTIHVSAMPLLRTVGAYAFSDLPNLRELHMHSCHHLDTIEADAFSGTTGVKVLDLHGNALVSLQSTLLDWESMERLDLRFNHWDCSCHLSWLPQVLHDASNDSRYLAQNVLCQTPESRASRKVVDLQSTLESCSFTTTLVSPEAEEQAFQGTVITGILGTIGGVLLVIIVILMYKYRSSYMTVYAPTMDQYVHRSHGNSSRSRGGERAELHLTLHVDEDNMSGRKSALATGRSKGRRLQRVSFADDDVVKDI